MWVDVMYRMLLKSKLSNPPSSESSRADRSRASRWSRSRSTSTRASQSTELLPYV